MRSLQEVEALIILARKYHLTSLSVEGASLTLGPDPKLAENNLPVSEPEKAQDPLANKRSFYELALGKPLTDAELALYNEVG